MLLPINWLKDYVNIKLSVEKLADILRLKSFEVESISAGGPKVPGVIVAEILEIKKHPNADKLQLARVSDGEREYKIVCGAPNIKVGQRIPLATEGAKLPNGMEIIRREVRGEVSEGMICATDELGIGEDHSGILVLPKNARLGDDADQYFDNEGGPVIEFKITPDRADCLSILGLAREVSALTDQGVKYPEIKPKESKSLAKDSVSIQISDKDFCPQYFVRVIKGVKVGESSPWLKKRLKSIGLRSVNNVVDITNFVLFEFGQPLHAFDAAKIAGVKSKKLFVRKAKKGEKILALDGKIYELDSDVAVISDAKHPVAIAGIMGGEDSSVKENTTDIILEAAVFDSVQIRRAARKLGLRSDSSSRFERGFDPAITEAALNRAAILIKEVCGGEILKGSICVAKIKDKKKSVVLPIDYLNRMIGMEIPRAKVKAILLSHGFAVKEKGKDLEVGIPSFRRDVSHEADLVEEVARVYGYNELPEKYVKAELVPPQDNLRNKWEEKTRELLARAGFNELYNYSFYGEREISILNLKTEDHLELENPMNPDQKYLRISLLPLLFKSASENARRFDEVKIFEIGRVFLPKGSGMPEEELRVAAVISSKVLDDIDLYRELLGVEKIILDNLGAERGSETQMGIFSEFEKEQWKLKSGLVYFEINLEKLMQIAGGEKKYKSISVYPEVLRDLSIIIPEDKNWGEIEDAVKKSAGNILGSIELFDLYRGKGIESGKKSVAFHLIFSSNERTLTSEEIDGVMGLVVKNLEQKLDAKLRG